MANRRGKAEEGLTSTELAVIMPVLIMLILVPFQVALWWHADQIAERLRGATEDDLRRVVAWRRTLLASRGHPREALEQTLASLRENPGFHGLWCAVPTLYWELREPELAVATVAETVAVPATIRRVVRTMACLSSIALERYDEADAATLAPDPGFTESARRHIRLVCAAPHVEMPFDLLLLACSIEQPPRYDDVWETWLLRTAAWRARRAGSIDRAERAEQAADRRAARLPIDLQQRIPPPGPFR